ncbi:hypothetical protein BC831DRAFT_508371 [Entophlyctis helioformis]|nr:hypothetical protein BC831DRAFT_508371 [Entophlyctis helioformis]
MPIQLFSEQVLQPTPRIDPLSTSQWLLIAAAAASHVAVGKHQAAWSCDANALAVLLNNNQLALFTAVLPTSLADWSHQTCTHLPSVRPPCWARLSDGHDHTALLDGLLHGPLDGLLHATLSIGRQVQQRLDLAWRVAAVLASRSVCTVQGLSRSTNHSDSTRINQSQRFHQEPRQSNSRMLLVAGPDTNVVAWQADFKKALINEGLATMTWDIVNAFYPPPTAKSSNSNSNSSPAPAPPVMVPPHLVPEIAYNRLRGWTSPSLHFLLDDPTETDTPESKLAELVAFCRRLAAVSRAI